MKSMKKMKILKIKALQPDHRLDIFPRIPTNENYKND